MKTSLQFFKDMGACEGSMIFLTEFFEKHGLEEADYLWGYNLLTQLPEFFESIEKHGTPGHDTAEGWLKWAYDLRWRPEAITYFGDHHRDPNEFRTFDGAIHDSLEDAQRYLKSVQFDTTEKRLENLVINGIKKGLNGRETWEVIDPEDVSDDYDDFVFYNETTGENIRIDTVEEALEKLREQRERIEEIQRKMRRIEQRVWSSCYHFYFWDPVA